MNPLALRRLRAAALVLFVGAAALAIAAARGAGEVPEISAVPAIDNPGPNGLELAFRWLSRGPNGARVLHTPLTELPPEVRVVVSALPYARIPLPNERVAMREWVEAGGTLVLIGQHDGESGPLGAEFAPTQSMALHLRADSQVGVEALGSDVKALLDAARGLDQGREAVVARPALPDPLLRGLGALAVGPGAGFALVKEAEAAPWIVAGETPVALSLRHGAGRVLLLAGPELLSNGWLDLGDNLGLLASLGRLGPVAFDELHHTAEDAASMARLLPLVGPLLLQGLLVALVALAAVGRRLGPAQQLPPAPAPSARAYAERLGELMARVGVAASLLPDLERELRASAAARTGLDPGVGFDAFAARLGEAEAPLGRALVRLGGALKAGGPTVSPEQAAELIESTARLSRELRGGAPG